MKPRIEAVLREMNHARTHSLKQEDKIIESASLALLDLIEEFRMDEVGSHATFTNMNDRAIDGYNLAVRVLNMKLDKK